MSSRTENSFHRKCLINKVYIASVTRTDQDWDDNECLYLLEENQSNISSMSLILKVVQTDRWVILWFLTEKKAFCIRYILTLSVGVQTPAVRTQLHHRLWEWFYPYVALCKQEYFY